MFYSFTILPLFTLFDKDPLPSDPEVGIYKEFDDDSSSDYSIEDRTYSAAVGRTALIIPCHKSERVIESTLDAAVKIFPPSQIFVIANGTSTTPLDDTEFVCSKYGVNHVWVPVKSKIVAQYVGCYVAREFDSVLLTDDDCILPSNFPLATDKLLGKVRCVGYGIKSTRRKSLCQMAQDAEYKFSSLQKVLAARLGSATAPHGALSLWDREFLQDTLRAQPGFSLSEEWLLGHHCRQLGGCVKMCSAVFASVPVSSGIFSGRSRHSTIWRRRFSPWNFFFVNSIWYNLYYILFNWKLGSWELSTKIFLLREVS
jgi:hypothetical protein